MIESEIKPTYEEILNNISLILNSNNPHKDNNSIKALLQELKTFYNITLSIRFLENLIESPKKEIRHLKIKYLVKALNLKVNNTFRDYKQFITIKKRIEWPIYCYNQNNKVVLKELKVFNVGISKRQHLRESLKLLE